jgi:hypothetical protein
VKKFTRKIEKRQHVVRERESTDVMWKQIGLRFTSIVYDNDVFWDGGHDPLIACKIQGDGNRYWTRTSTLVDINKDEPGQWLRGGDEQGLCFFQERDGGFVNGRETNDGGFFDGHEHQLGSVENGDGWGNANSISCQLFESNNEGDGSMSNEINFGELERRGEPKVFQCGVSPRFGEWTVYFGKGNNKKAVIGYRDWFCSRRFATGRVRNDPVVIRPREEPYRNPNNNGQYYENQQPQQPYVDPTKPVYTQEVKVANRQLTPEEAEYARRHEEWSKQYGQQYKAAYGQEATAKFADGTEMHSKITVPLPPSHQQANYEQAYREWYARYGQQYQTQYYAAYGQYPRQ